MNKIIVKYKHCEKPTVYDVVSMLTYKKGKNEMLLTEARDTVNGIDTRVEWFEVVEERATRGEGDGESKSYESKYERENITLPKEMAKAKEDEWCHYSGMPSPSSYEQKTKRGKRS